MVNDGGTGGPMEQPGAAETDSLVAMLEQQGADRPESQVLHQLVGRWRTETAWEPRPGKGVRRSEGSMVAAPILEGRAVEMRTFGDEEREVARVLLAFDPSGHDYVAFSLTVLSGFFTLERGPYSPGERVLALDGREPAPERGIVIDYRRSIRFVAPDTFTVDISYPGVPPGTYGPMHITYRREA